MGAGKSLSALWRPFFTNAIVKLGRLRSPAPVALQYNPLLDLAVFTLWEKQEEGYRVASVRALPGERLAGPGGAAKLRPQWTTAKRGPAKSQTAELTAEMYKVFLGHAPACFATETRPHCAAANRRDLEEMRWAYRSALETARQYRGG